MRALVAVIGAVSAGATAVVADVSWPEEQRAEALRLAGVGRAENGTAHGTRYGAAHDACPGTRYGAGHDGHDDLAWIGFTSGSAGTPRPIGRTAESWIRSFPIVSERTGIGPGQTVLIGGSLSSSLFLFGTLHALWAGAHVMLSDRWDPERLPAADAAHCVPAMLMDLLGTRNPPGTVICGGAALPAPVRTMAQARGMRVSEYYGATELSFVAWRDADSADGPDGQCGTHRAGGRHNQHNQLRAFPGVEIDIREREIWARSPYLSTGYVTAEVTGPLRWDSEGFATVGDHGVLGDDGGLTIFGRGDGTMLTGGSLVTPSEVEAVLLSVPGVRDVVVVGTPHPRMGSVVTALIEPKHRADVQLADLRAAARMRLTPPQRPRHWYTMRPLPRTSAGKPARRLIADAASAGTLTALNAERLR